MALFEPRPLRFAITTRGGGRYHASPGLTRATTRLMLRAGLPAYWKMTAMSLKSAKEASKVALSTQYCVPCHGSLTRTDIGETPETTTVCSSRV